MQTLYLVCAAAGVAVMVWQFLSGLLGLGDHHDFSGDHDVSAGHDTHHGVEHDSSWYFSMLSLRALAAALTFFGLIGLAATAATWEPPWALAAALVAGGGSLALVAYVLQAFRKLQADGTARIDRAVGKTATVYLKVPGRRAGAGKVHLNLQNRTVECDAVTDHDEFPTGSRALVVAVLGADTVEIAPLPANREEVRHDA